MKECDIQKQIVDYIREKHGNWLIFSVPNEATFRRSTYFKSIGALPGAPDLILLMDNGETLLIEVKNEKGRQRPEQRVFELKASVLGHKYVIVRNLHEVISLLGDNMLANI